MGFNIHKSDKDAPIRSARVLGSRKTRCVPFEDIQKVLGIFEREASLPRKERAALLHELYPEWKNRDYGSYKNRCRVKTAVGSWRLLLMIALPLYTGFRRSDVIKLKWSDLLYFGANQELAVRPQFTILEQKTQRYRRPRTIPLGSDIGFYIMKFYAQVKPRDLDTYIFIAKTKSGTPHITGPGYCVKINDAFARFDIFDGDGKVAPHSLRKSYCQYIFKEFGSNFDALLKLQKILGHSTIEITIKYLDVDISESTTVHNAISFRGTGPRP